MITAKRADNGKDGRFTLHHANEVIAEMNYSWQGDDVIVIKFSGVAQEYQGKGYGRKVFLEMVKFAQEENIKVLPLCPFARAQFDKHSEFSHLLA